MAFTATGKLDDNINYVWDHRISRYVWSVCLSGGCSRDLAPWS